MTNILKLSVSILLLFIISCKTSEPVVDIVKSSQKEVTALTLANISGTTSTFDASTNTHTFSVPSGTNIKALALTFTLPNGATSSPTSGSVQDFTNPVSYTITAEDGTKQVVKIAVNVQAAPKSSEKQILEFSFNALNPVVKANIDQTSRKITANVTASTDLTKLIATIITSPKSSVSPASGAVQIFLNTVAYEVTAEDGSKISYEIIVSKQVNNSNLPFKIISEHEAIAGLYQGIDTTFLFFNSQNMITKTVKKRFLNHLQENRFENKGEIVKEFLYENSLLKEFKIFERNKLSGHYIYDYPNNNSIIVNYVNTNSQKIKDYEIILKDDLPIKIILSEESKEYNGEITFDYKNDLFIGVKNPAPQSTTTLKLSYFGDTGVQNPQKTLDIIKPEDDLDFPENFIFKKNPFNTLPTVITSHYENPKYNIVRDIFIGYGYFFDNKGRFSKVERKATDKSVEPGATYFNAENKTDFYFY